MNYNKESRNRLKQNQELQRLLVRKIKKARRDKKARDGWKQMLAQAMRDFPTPAERLVRATLVQMGFRHQSVVCGFIPDFVHFGHRVIVEIDGGIHKQQHERDEARDEILRSKLWKVLRFTNAEVEKQPAKVYAAIKAALH